jgi:hypothetical protein
MLRSWWWAEAIDDRRNGRTIGAPSDADSLYRLLGENHPGLLRKERRLDPAHEARHRHGGSGTAGRMVDDYATKYYGVKE